MRNSLFCSFNANNLQRSHACTYISFCLGWGWMELYNCGTLLGRVCCPRFRKSWTVRADCHCHPAIISSSCNHVIYISMYHHILIDSISFWTRNKFAADFTKTFRTQGCFPCSSKCHHCIRPTHDPSKLIR